jgi:hypothetical protein
VLKVERSELEMEEVVQAHWRRTQGSQPEAHKWLIELNAAEIRDIAKSFGDDIRLVLRH